MGPAGVADRVDPDRDGDGAGHQLEEPADAVEPERQAGHRNQPPDPQIQIGTEHDAAADHDSEDAGEHGGQPGGGAEPRPRGRQFDLAGLYEVDARYGESAAHRPVTDRSAAMMASGGGGQPGTARSTGTTSLTAPTTPYAPANTPQLRAQSPTATTTRGSGTASKVLRNGPAMFRVTTPVTRSASACLGDATRRAPKRSAS